MAHSDNLTPPHEDGLTGLPSVKEKDDSGVQSDSVWVSRTKSILSIGSDTQNSIVTRAWARNYRAFGNRHFTGSKYESPKYKNRSKLFKPKTRSAVRKNDATAASSLFSTEDVVSITAEDATDKLQVSTARFVHEVMNYRLDRSNRWAGPNWFMTAVGARQDSQITGICVSKQYWEYEVVEIEELVTVQTAQPVLDELGNPVLDLATGMPKTTMVESEELQKTMKVMKDRPMITLIPPEHAFIDPTGDWRDPIEEGGFFAAAYPCRKEDIETIISSQQERHQMGGGKWRDIDIDTVTSGKSGGMSRQQAAQVRRARQEGTDRYQSRMQDEDDSTIWLYECFYRENGEDWTWWMLGETIVLSNPRPTEEAYPEQFGSRPYVRGVGALETHKTHPMAPVESWQPMQMEINDLTNLRLDAAKMAISPITKVRKGRGIDLKQVQNRGPDAAIMVEAMDDLAFDKAPDPSQTSMLEVNVISNDFDDLAGVFSGSSVQNNRQLNETVGGMNLLSQNANSLTEYDLRVWIETWVEHVLQQFVNLILYYENDETVIKVAGQKAGLIENQSRLFDAPMQEQGQQPQMPPQQGGGGGGLDPQQAQQKQDQQKNPFAPQVTVGEVVGNLDKAQLSLKVSVGLGSLNSQQRLQKFGIALKMSAELGPILKAQGIQPNAAAIAQEIFGLSGYKDGDRFFIKADEDKSGPPPEVQLKQMDIQAKAGEVKANNQTKMQIAQMQAQLDKQKLELEAAKIRLDGHRVGIDGTKNKLDHQRELAKMNATQQTDPITGEPVVKDKTDVLAETQGQAMQQMAQQMMQMFQSVVQQQQEASARQEQQMGQYMTALATEISTLKQITTAPVELIRDANGRVQGGRKVL